LYPEGAGCYRFQLTAQRNCISLQHTTKLWSCSILAPVFNGIKEIAIKTGLNIRSVINECEQIFFNEPRLLADDRNHSGNEKRWYALGKTDLNRCLFVVFTIRERLMRIISARDMNIKERKIYYGKA
jgi:uncharacterized DUF497 family protein